MKLKIKNFWKDIGPCLKYIGLSIWEFFKILFIFACFFGVIFSVVKLGQAFIRYYKTNNEQQQKYNIEKTESFIKYYAGKYFYKFNIDGHEYLYISGNNVGGVCHLESCLCKTNKLGVIQCQDVHMQEEQ